MNKNNFFNIFFKVIVAVLFITSIKSPMVTHAEWDNNAVDYVKKYGESLKYLDGAFWLAQYGVAGSVDSVRYAVLGFKTSTTFNGKTYSFSSKVDGSFKLVDERTSDGKVYSLWKIDYNTVIARLKKDYPDTDFSSLYSQSVDSTYEFNAIMSVKKSGKTTPDGSIDDTGKVLSNPVYTTKDAILKAETWYDPAPTEIGNLFGIKTNFAASAKTTSLIPNLTHFRLENYDYKDPNSETYWIKPTTIIRPITESGLSISYGVYPDVIYLRVYKNSTSNNRTFYLKRTSPTTVYHWDSGSPGDITYTSSTRLNSYASLKVNYICGDFYLKLPDDGATYGFQYTSTYNSQGPAYLETGKKVKVDGKAPSINGATNFGWSNSNGSINITASDSGSGINSIKLYKNGTLVSTSTSTSLVYTNTSEGITTFKVEATDNVGNTSSATFTHYIDKTAPTVSINTTANEWKPHSITATILSSDNASGIHTTQYKLSGATNQDWTNYNGTITLSNNGSTTISARAYDNTGNISSTSTVTVYVDTTNPSVAMNADANKWLNTNTQVTMSASDSYSGVNRIEYSMSGATSVGWTKYSNAVTVSNNGKTTVYTKSYDNAGNVSSQISKEIWIDKTNPITAISTTKTTWKNKAIAVSISASDSVSYITKIEYKLIGAKNQDWTIYTGTFNISTNGKTTIQARSYDAAGNISSIDSAEVWYDDVAPTAKFSAASATVDRTVNINVSSLFDVHSDLNYVTLSNSPDFSSSTVYDVTGKTSATIPFVLDKQSTVETNYTLRTIYIRLYDNANNYRYYTVEIKLDPAKPAPPVINLPITNDTLYVTKETFVLKWSHKNGENEFDLPQTHATIVLTNRDTNKSETIHIDGAKSEYRTVNLEPGEYSATITTNNFGPHTSNTSTIIFRYNKFYNSGLVRTITITPQNKLKYVSVATKAEIPKGCEIEGRLYYIQKSNGTIDYTEYKTFKITRDYKNNLLRFDNNINILQIDLILKNNTKPYNPYISPILDNITVYAK